MALLYPSLRILKVRTASENSDVEIIWDWRHQFQEKGFRRNTFKWQVMNGCSGWTEHEILKCIS